jgi:hypothetical protein
VCSGCENKITCPTGTCPAARFKRLQPYLKFLHSTSSTYEFDQSNNVGQSAYDDVFKIMSCLKSDTSQSREQVTQTFFPPNPATSPSSPARALAVRLAVHALVMLDCLSPGGFLGELESGDYSMPWSNTQSLQDSVSKGLPQSNHPLFTHADTAVTKDAARSIQASELSQRALVRFRATDYLSRHLLWNAKYRTIEIFHHTSFLKEYLLASKNLAQRKAR